jgi:hypothetical protein
MAWKKEGVVDAEKSTKKKVTYYLYDLNDNLVKRSKIIYSPFNIKTYGRSKDEDGYRDPRIVTFTGWVYETSDEEDMEFLDSWDMWARLSNWKDFKWDSIHRIKKEKPHQKAEIETVTETVKIQTIPRVVAETMTIDQLKQLASEWKIKIELPEDFKWEVKDYIIGLFKESEHITD